MYDSKLREDYAKSKESKSNPWNLEGRRQLDRKALFSKPLLPAEDAEQENRNPAADNPGVTFDTFLQGKETGNHSKAAGDNSKDDDSTQMSDFKVDPSGAMVRRSMGRAPMLQPSTAVVLDGDTSDSALKPKDQRDSLARREQIQLNLHEDEDEESEGEKLPFDKVNGGADLREPNLSRFENSTSQLHLQMQRTSAEVDYSQKYEDCFTSSCLESMKQRKEAK